MAEEIKVFRFTNRFRKEYHALPKEIREAFDQKLTMLLNDMKHPCVKNRFGKDRRNSIRKCVTLRLS